MNNEPKDVTLREAAMIKQRRAEYLECVELAFERGWGETRIARSLGVSVSMAGRMLRKARACGDLPPRARGNNRAKADANALGEATCADEANATSGEMEIVDNPTGRTITCKGGTIRTIDGALAAADVDLAKWEIESSSVRKWDVTLGTDPPTQVQNWYVAVKLRPRKPPCVQMAIESIASRIAPREPIPFDGSSFADGGHTLELCLFDHHFGLLSWHPETGADYDLRIAERLFIHGVSEALRRAEPYPCERILLPIGNDMFHIDDDTNRTPQNKNPLDVDCRLAKVFEAGIDATVQAVSMCLERTGASVELLWIPGNHDPHTGYYLGKVLQAVYRNEPRVSVDVSPTSRKYRRIGRVLIGYTHGCDERASSLPLVMATEAGQDWSQCDIREWHIGHKHAKRQTHYTSGDTMQGVAVVVLPSLAWADKWHYGKGYVAPIRSTEARVWHPTHGQVAMLTTYADASMYRQYANGCELSGK